MTAKMMRKVIKIDEDKCDGCGACVIACAEGALQIVEGKLRLVSERFCDGLGACLGECPKGALSIEEREAEEFDEEAVSLHLHEEEAVPDSLPCGCSSATVAQFDLTESTVTKAEQATYRRSMLGHWPVQLALVPPGAPFIKGADLLLVADCVPFAFAGFHEALLKGHVVLVACPKLDDFQSHQAKLCEILRRSGPSSITVVHMEVPCCSGLAHMARKAVGTSGRGIPFKEIIVTTRGELQCLNLP
ncbi:MAG: 4Fe-4S binding protein [Chloroflexota bacterium]